MYVHQGDERGKISLTSCCIVMLNIFSFILFKFGLNYYLTIVQGLPKLLSVHVDAILFSHLYLHDHADFIFDIMILNWTSTFSWRWEIFFLQFFL